MTKFFLCGPIAFLPKNAPLNGLLSLPFVCLCLLNTMFGCRALCLESAFFTSYRKQSYNTTTFEWHKESIEPMIPPQYRLLVYLAPCLLSLIINVIRLYYTSKGLRTYLLQYPQFVVGSCFTPFMFEGQKLANSDNRYTVRIWKLGTFLNALYIGCFPQCLLLLMEYYKGVNTWEFIGNKLKDQYIYENNDALFKSPQGNTIFSITCSTLFFILILIFFGTKSLFKNRGIHCRCLYVLCCPCPDPCIHYSEPPSSTQTKGIISPVKNDANDESLGEEEISVQDSKSHTEIYLYKNKGGQKRWLVGQETTTEVNIALQVTKCFLSRIWNCIIVFIFQSLPLLI